MNPALGYLFGALAAAALHVVGTLATLWFLTQPAEGAGMPLDAAAFVACRCCSPCSCLRSV